MKVHIFYVPKLSSWGGGNQFLRALKTQFTKRGLYSDLICEADTVVFNGYQELGQLFLNWLLCHRKKRIYRLGPVMSLHRSHLRWKIIDAIMVIFANLFTDIVIFQSRWSYDQARKRGFSRKKKCVVILNAVDGGVFPRKSFESESNRSITKLIYTSWSKNANKGFEYLKFLDDNLDFTKYEMTFVGNCEIQFKNIKMIKPVSSLELSAELRKNDIFITPAKDDACSNALLEALASGLPAVALKSGGSPEIVGSGGELFTDTLELLQQIDKVASNVSSYRGQIHLKSIEETAEDYLSAIRSI